MEHETLRHHLAWFEGGETVGLRKSDVIICSMKLQGNRQGKLMLMLLLLLLLLLVTRTRNVGGWPNFSVCLRGPARARHLRKQNRNGSNTNAHERVDASLLSLGLSKDIPHLHHPQLR